MPFDRNAYQREYMRQRRAAQKADAPAPVQRAPLTAEQRASQAAYMREYRAARPTTAEQREKNAARQRRYQARKVAASIAAHEARIRANADAIAAHLRQRMGGSCVLPRDVLAVLNALKLDLNDWTPAVQLLRAEGRARWTDPAHHLDESRLILSA